MADQFQLFGAGASLPEGFQYRNDVISRDQEVEVMEQVRLLPLREFEFHGFVGKRRTASFGWSYDFVKQQLKKADDIPPFLLWLRAGAADFAGIRPGDLQQ